jgi:hypothetical protein
MSLRLRRHNHSAVALVASALHALPPQPLCMRPCCVPCLQELAGLQQLVRVANTTYAPGYGAWSGAGSMRGPRSMFGGLEGGWGAAPWTGGCGGAYMSLTCVQKQSADGL